MKRWMGIFLLAVFLCGCRAEETLETVNDEWIVPVMAQPREISLHLPEDALTPVLEREDCRLYMGQGYELMLERHSSGDLNTTIQSVSGYEKEQLTVLQTRHEGIDRYDFVWSAAAEQGERLGRAVILDDGNFHYCITVLRDPGETEIVWREVFESVSFL